VLGLSALIEIQSSRLAARVDSEGRPVLLLDQDRRRWDRLHINRGLDALARADALDAPYGPYRLQAAIASCHAVAFHPEETDWARIAVLYGELATIMPSPIIELNRAVAIAMVEPPAGGPAAALEIVEGLADDPALARYHLLPSVRGDLLHRLGRNDEAVAEFERAASLTENARERELSRARADTIRSAGA
jgi:predicted RNA polymerase sigma factor